MPAATSSAFVTSRNYGRKSNIRRMMLTQQPLSPGTIVIENLTVVLDSKEGETRR
jgi:hypothetical protein